jgi:hypothetical protein
MFKKFRSFFARQRGSIPIMPIISIVIALVVLGAIIPVLWPMFVGSGTSIAALTGTDAATVTMKSFWPIIEILGGLAIGIGVLMFIVNKFTHK